MRSSLLRRGLAAGAALAAGIAVLSVAPPAAHAQSPNGTTTWPAADTMLMAAGSDTTQNMMNDILAAHDGETDYDGTGVLHTYNLAAIPSGTVQVDGGTDCPQHAWNPGSLVYTPPPAQWTAPSGSSAGRDYLKAQEGYAAGDLFASYIHLHFAGYPALLGHWLERCRAYASARPGGPSA